MGRAARSAFSCERIKVPVGRWRLQSTAGHFGQLMGSQFSRTRWALSLLLALMLIAASGCGAGEKRTNATSAQAPQSGRQSVSVTPGAVPAPHPPVIRAGRTIRRFSGSGNHAIGSVSAKTAVVLQWSTSGQGFQLITRQGFLLLDSHARAGRIRLSPGDYRLRVASPARWTVLVRASA